MVIICIHADGEPANRSANAFQEEERFIMKEGIHPAYKEATITCVCGNVIKTRSTKQEMRTDICSQCHPFMTGKQKIIDTQGRVERFKKKYAGQQNKT